MQVVLSRRLVGVAGDDRIAARAALRGGPDDARVAVGMVEL